MNTATSLFLCQLIIPMLFSYGYERQQNQWPQKYTSNAGNFDCYMDAAVWWGVHCPMEHILGFTKSHWMPPLGKRLRRIAPTAATVDDCGCKHKNTYKTQLLASNYGTLAGNVGICVCQLYSPNDRHLCLLSTCQQCWPDMLATFY